MANLIKTCDRCNKTLDEFAAPVPFTTYYLCDNCFNKFYKKEKVETEKEVEKLDDGSTQG